MLNKDELQKIKSIAYYTAKEIIKSKVLINTIIIGLGLLIATFVAYSFTYGEPARVALDFGLGALSLSTVGIALFIGVGILADEIDSRTVYLVISRPVTRRAFILGKLLGLFSVLALNVVILSIITLSLFFIIGGEYQNLISWSILFIGIEAGLMLLIVSLLSLVTNKVLAVILAIVIYIVGHAIDGVKLLTFVELRPIIGKVLEIYHYILPGFYKLNIKEFVLYNQKLDYSYLYGSLFYAIIYGLVITWITIIVFEKKNLD